MSEIKVIFENDRKIFENKVNELLKADYKLLNTNCAFQSRNEEYSSLQVYQAVLKSTPKFTDGW